MTVNCLIPPSSAKRKTKQCHVEKWKQRTKRLLFSDFMFGRWYRPVQSLWWGQIMISNNRERNNFLLFFTVDGYTLEQCEVVVCKLQSLQGTGINSNIIRDKNIFLSPFEVRHSENLLLM
ncbi:MAG: hypothetical protein IPN49_15480 [Saprospiraceae bacterium]|nr:hypothetical protein [Saprospiraceae bacterium]